MSKEWGPFWIEEKEEKRSTFWILIVLCLLALIPGILLWR